MKKGLLTTGLIAMTCATFAQTTPRLPLVEIFTSNTCGPCASFNGPYQPILDANSPNQETGAGVAVIRYQMDWPAPGTDPSYNDDADIRKGFYSVSGIPDPWIDGAVNSGQQADIDASIANPAQLIVEAAYTETGNDLDINVRVTPLADLGAGSRVFVAIVNNNYGYTGGTNGESQFHYVARKVLPTGAGDFMSPLQENVVQFFNYQYTYTVASGTPAQMSNDLWNNDYSIVAWVQRSTGTKEVWNSTIAYQGLLGTPTEVDKGMDLKLYPNPTESQSIVSFESSTGDDVTIDVYNSIGQLVSTEVVAGQAGKQTHVLNMEGYASGLYQIRIDQNGATASETLIVN